LFAFEQSCGDENLEVVAHGRLAESERFLKVADAGVAVGLGLDQAQESESRRVGDDSERGCELFGVVGGEWFFRERGAAGGGGGERRHLLTH
jgi:hypothetical protein